MRIVKANRPPCRRRTGCFVGAFGIFPGRVGLNQELRGLRPVCGEGGAPTPSQVIVEAWVDQLDGIARRISHRWPRKTELVFHFVSNLPRWIAERELAAIF